MTKPLTVAELADYLSVSATWVYRQVEAGAIPFTRLPSAGATRKPTRIRFTSDQVEQILRLGEQSVINPSVVDLATERRKRAAA